MIPTATGRRNPDRFRAAAMARVLRRAGRVELAADIERAFGLQRTPRAPACRCWCGLVRLPTRCAACRRLGDAGEGFLRGRAWS